MKSGENGDSDLAANSLDKNTNTGDVQSTTGATTPLFTDGLSIAIVSHCTATVDLSGIPVIAQSEGGRGNCLGGRVDVVIQLQDVSWYKKQGTQGAMSWTGGLAPQVGGAVWSTAYCLHAVSIMRGMSS